MRLLAALALYLPVAAAAADWTLVASSTRATAGEEIELLKALNGVVEDWWISMGHPWKVLFGERRIGLPTVRFEVDFRAPALLEDELRFTLAIKRIGSKSVELDHVVLALDLDLRARRR